MRESPSDTSLPYVLTLCVCVYVCVYSTKAQMSTQQSAVGSVLVCHAVCVCVCVWLRPHKEQRFTRSFVLSLSLSIRPQSSETSSSDFVKV